MDLEWFHSKLILAQGSFLFEAISRMHPSGYYISRCQLVRLYQLVEHNIEIFLFLTGPLPNITYTFCIRVITSVKLTVWFYFHYNLRSAVLMLSEKLNTFTSTVCLMNYHFHYNNLHSAILMFSEKLNTFTSNVCEKFI